MYQIYLTPFAKLIAGLAILLVLLGALATALRQDSTKAVGAITNHAPEMATSQRVDRSDSLQIADR